MKLAQRALAGLDGSPHRVGAAGRHGAAPAEPRPPDPPAAAARGALIILERVEFLAAAPHERTESRRGYANGFKSKTVATRVGSIEFAVPQVRDVVDGESFYPSALEQGLRSEVPVRAHVVEIEAHGDAWERAVRWPYAEDRSAMVARSRSSSCASVCQPG